MYPPELTLSQDEWNSFQRHYMLVKIKNPDRRLGAAFYNYFDEKMDALKRGSHLGGNPGHCPSMDDVLYSERDDSMAMDMITDWFQFSPDAV